jgi:hypothetical protein
MYELMKKRNKIFIGLLGIFSAVMLVFLFGVKVTNAVSCATGVVKGKTLTATCQTSTWSYSCPSGYTNENRASVTDSKYGTSCSGSETCCFKDSEIENQSGTCGEGKGTCKFSVAIGGTICGDDEKIGQDTCSWGYSCCVPKANVGVGGSNPTAGASPTVPGAAGTGAAGSSAAAFSARTGSTGGLVPCTDDCTLCHLVLGFKNIYDYLLVLLLSATTLVVVVAGVMYMVSSGDKGMIDKAKSALTYALTAMILALVAWLIINATLNALGYNKSGSWYNFTCDTTQTKGPTGGTGGGTLPGTQGAGGGSGSYIPSGNLDPKTQEVLKNYMTMNGWSYGERSVANGSGDCFSTTSRAWELSGLKDLDHQKWETWDGNLSSIKPGDVIQIPNVHTALVMEDGKTSLASTKTGIGVYPDGLNQNIIRANGNLRIIHLANAASK